MLAGVPSQPPSLISPEFLERLTQKENQLDDKIRKLEEAMENLSQLTEKVNMRDREILYSPKRTVMMTPRKAVKKKVGKKVVRRESPTESKPKRKSLGLTQSKKTLKKMLKEKISSPIKRNPNERQITREYSFILDYEPVEPVQVQSIPMGPTRTIYANQDTKTRYPDGTVKIKTHDGMLFTKYANGDYQQQYPDGASCYRYSSNRSIELRTPSGRAVFIFENGQREEHSPDGSKHITFVNGSIMEIGSDGACKVTDRKGRTKIGKINP